MNFASDNGAGVAPEILEAIAASSRVNAPAYGADEYTGRAQARLSEVFETRVAAYLVATGTAANALALAALVNPWDAVFCHEEAHIHDDECGAPEFFAGGAKLVGIAGRAARSRREASWRRWSGFRADLSSRRSRARCRCPRSPKRGQSTASAKFRISARSRIEMGCACIWMARASPTRSYPPKATPAEMTWRAGVDILTFGATKNGALACEAVVFFDPARAENFAFQRKRGGHTLSKGRFLGAQMEAYLADGLWLRLAERANASARRLSRALAATPGVRLAWPTDANEVFVVAPNALVAAGARPARSCMNGARARWRRIARRERARRS